MAAAGSGPGISGVSQLGLLLNLYIKTEKAPDDGATCNVHLQGIEDAKRKLAAEDARLLQYEKQQVLKEAAAVADKKAKAATANSAILEVN